MSERVRVVVRIRPFIASDPPDAELNTIVLDSTHVGVGDRRVFTADRVFMMEDGSDDIYGEVVTPLVDRFIGGCNASVLAYGQTGTGKTYTVQSILPLLLTQVLESPLLNGGGAATGGTSAVLARLKQQPLLRLQYVEVYGETLRDLLEDPRTRPDPSKAPKLRLVTTAGANPSLPFAQPQCSVVGATVRPVYSIREAAALISSGDARRATGATNVHERSSRSHAILTLFHPRYNCRLDVVDLAGSEREKKTGNTGLRFQESIAINTGLLALGNVIRALSRNHRSAQAKATQHGGPAPLAHTQSPGDDDDTATAANRHVPYRSSKLTRLLQDTLGGSSATLFIACVAPDTHNRDETLRTLQYCSLALQVLNVPVRQCERLQRAPSRERGGRKGSVRGAADADADADADTAAATTPAAAAQTSSAAAVAEELAETRTAYAQLQLHYDEQAEVLASICESHAAAKEQLEVWEGELRADADLFARQTRLIQRLVRENKALRHRQAGPATAPAAVQVCHADATVTENHGVGNRDDGVRTVAYPDGWEEVANSEEDPVRALLQRLLKEQRTTDGGGGDGADACGSAASDARLPPLRSARSPHRHLSFTSAGSTLPDTGHEDGRLGIGHSSPARPAPTSGDDGVAVSSAPSVPIQSYIQSLLRQHGILLDAGAGGVARAATPLDASPVVNVGVTPRRSAAGEGPSSLQVPPHSTEADTQGQDVVAAASPRAAPEDLQVLQLASELLRYEETNTDLRNQVRLLQVRLDEKTREAARLRLEVQDMKDVYSSLSAMTE